MKHAQLILGMIYLSFITPLKRSDGEMEKFNTFNSQGQLHTINPSAAMGLLENLTYSPSGNIESAHILLGSEGGMCIQISFMTIPPITLMMILVNLFLL